jgi:DNA gyrase subunit A
VHFSPINLPGVPHNSVSLSAGVPAGDYVDLETGESVVGIVSLNATTPLALGTRQGTVKRIDIGGLSPKSGLSLISLKDDDVVVGAALAADSDELVFIASDTQLLRFSAESVRPQGASAGGMAGIRLADDASVIYFGSVTPGADSVVVTVSTSFSTLLGTDTGRVKVSPFADFPAKGRATGGVRAHALLKGEDALLVAWAGTAPAVANGLDGSPRELPTSLAKRDGSGEKLSGDISFIGSAAV